MAFFPDGKFEVIPALNTITANEIVEAPEIVFHRDVLGMGNPGVFLKKHTDTEDGEAMCVCVTTIYVELKHLYRTYIRTVTA